MEPVKFCQRCACLCYRVTNHSMYLTLVYNCLSLSRVVFIYYFLHAIRRCQISVACHVALQSLDPTICGITVKRAMQKLTTLFGGVFSKEDQRLLTDVAALLQRMHSKVNKNLVCIKGTEERRKEREREREREKVCMYICE